jgi:hypothetical protein
MRHLWSASDAADKRTLFAASKSGRTMFVTVLLMLSSFEALVPHVLPSYARESENKVKNSLEEEY